ncbi:DnaB-like helicase N-terminal domain-containing protein [Catelliglobosispora koreensis]|uniref:DnaB-like helicase N-terminal domain-containing protein n=1 Tax=Catelliglobosispora koreensis TaxID=129052 RepID=UPI000369AB74|nr:DnaB-like helicase N-terminal domain-containing protein [Catelliglobosispora koreensis]
MTDLIMRAEQGVLGALLSARDPDEHALVYTSLDADMFGHPAHQAIYTALADLRLGDYTQVELITAVGAAVDRGDVDTAWLTQLAADAPDDPHVRAYVKIVLNAAFDRDMLDFADPYLAAAELENDLEARAALQHTGAALEAQAAIFAASSIIAPDTSVVSTSVVVEVDLTREEQVLADLLQHPDQAGKVAAWLDPEVFTTEQRRMAFEITVSHAYHGDPVDPVIVAWEIERGREINAYYQREPGPADPEREPDYRYLTRLGATAVATGTAVVIGHELLSEHVSAGLAVSAAAAHERQASAARQQPAATTQAPLESSAINPVTDRRIEL